MKQKHSLRQDAKTIMSAALAAADPTVEAAPALHQCRQTCYCRGDMPADADVLRSKLPRLDQDPLMGLTIHLGQTHEQGTMNILDRVLRIQGCCARLPDIPGFKVGLGIDVGQRQSLPSSKFGVV